MNSQFDGAFQIFTHFGCKYRDLRRRAGKEWCTYCSLASDSVLRKPESVCQEIREALTSAAIKPGARLMLKCYGDNASAIGAHLQSLAEMIQTDAALSQFDLRWSLYAQSSYISPRLVDIFRRLRVFEVYIGFDSGDDSIQLMNGLGTTVKSHINAGMLLRDADIRIQAGFVLGCAGETKESIEATMRFAFRLAELGNVDLFHASPLVVLPGSPAFRMLCNRVPAIRDIDLLDTTRLQHEWIRHFCPGLGDADAALTYLDETARNIGALGRLASSFGGWAERH
jgi:tRNA A37 methylthiotransferase MiaB